MADFDEDELTELLDPDFPRIDLVGRPASGVPRMLIAKQDEGAAGLLDPEFVRTLIGKQAGPEPGPGAMVTMTATPAAMAEMLARVRKGTQDEDVAKAKNDTADRKHKAATGAAMSDGSYPIASVADLTKAIHAVGRGGSSHDAIRRHIISRARSLGASSKIPDNWNSDGSLKESVSKEAGVPDTVTKADMGPDLDDGVDGMDPTVPLAAPGEDKPGDPTDPGSPAWEAIDAATAQKWTSIAVRLKNALCVMAEREMLEAASADPGDASAAWDLEDAMCAVDYVIGTLAGFAVDEQAEADLGGEAMDAVGKSAAPPAAVLAAIAKAMGTDGLPAALMTVETFGAVIAKSGRVLSSVNETHIREAASRLNTVLSSLPQAPTTDDGQPVAKMTPAEEAGMPEASPSEDVTAASGQQPAMGTAEPAPVAKAEDGPSAPQDAAEAATAVAKADGDDGGKPAQVAVYDADGNLVGVANPDDITPLANVKASPKPDGDEVTAEPAADPADMTPQPPADAGTPAGAVDDDGTVAKQDGTIALTQDVLKSIAADAARTALEAQGAAHAEVVAKMAADNAGLAEELEVVKARLKTVEETPAAPKVFTNGAVPPANQLRGQDQGAGQPVDVAKALELKHRMYTADPAEAKQIHDDLNQLAIDGIAAIHRR